VPYKDDALTMDDTDARQNRKALGLLVKMQQALIRRLGEYVTENRSSLKMAADGVEGYGFSVHQLDELFLSRLNLIERTMAELQKHPAVGASRYRTLCFLASRAEVEQEINSRLETLTEARILGVSVSPSAGPAEPDTEDADGLAESAADGLGEPAVESAPDISATGDAGPDTALPDVDPTTCDERGVGDADCDVGEPREADALAGPRVEDDDPPEGQLLVTVLYYGPEPRST